MNESTICDRCGVAHLTLLFGINMGKHVALCVECIVEMGNTLIELKKKDKTKGRKK
jgi:hypothetical protein